MGDYPALIDGTLNHLILFPPLLQQFFTVQNVRQPIHANITTMATPVIHDAACIFCKIIKGEIPSKKLIETAHSYSFLDIQPLTEGHALIVPKYHGAKLHDIPDEFLVDVLPIAKKLSKALGVENNGLDNPIGYNVLQNNGKIAHQEVGHVHFHVIPKRDKDTGLVVGWPAQPTDFAKLDQTHKEIMAKLDSNL